jgi:hypothetical protein
MKSRSNFPPGTYQYLRDIGAFRPVTWCPRCFRMVSRWHDHHTKKGEFVPARKALATQEDKDDD